MAKQGRTEETGGLEPQVTRSVTCVVIGFDRLEPAARVGRPDQHRPEGSAGELVGRFRGIRFGEQLFDPCGHPFVPSRPIPLEFSGPEVPKVTALID